MGSPASAGRWKPCRLPLPVIQGAHVMDIRCVFNVKPCQRGAPKGGLHWALASYRLIIYGEQQWMKAYSLWLGNRGTQCWAAHFLTCMQEAAVLSVTCTCTNLAAPFSNERKLHTPLQTACTCYSCHSYQCFPHLCQCPLSRPFRALSRSWRATCVTSWVACAISVLEHGVCCTRVLVVRSVC